MKERKPFDYGRIPVDYYDRVLRGGNPVQRLWHLSKFEKVLDSLPKHAGQSILDVGCFAGTFLSLVPEERFPRQVGVDILPEQIDFANANFGRPYREFRKIASLQELSALSETFDCVTVLEVIEHLDREEIGVLFEAAVDRLKPGGKLVLTTPNYASAWPMVEWAVNRFSGVSYEDQHISKFTYWNIERQLERIYPELFRYLEVDHKKTSHAVAPFLAPISFNFARRLSRSGARRSWGLPFGNLTLLKLTRKANKAVP